MDSNKYKNRLGTKFELVNACNNDIQYLKEAKLYNIFKYSKELSDKEKNHIREYVNRHIPLEINAYKIISVNSNIIGCFSIVTKDDGIMLDEIFIEAKYRNLGIGTSIISDIISKNECVYLWVYKENIKAISLYRKLGFNVIDETEERYYMKHIGGV